MARLKSQSVWSLAEDAIIPIVSRLFIEGDELPGERRTFRYAGVAEYEGTGDYARLRTRVVQVASDNARKAPAQLFPVAIGPLLRLMESGTAAAPDVSIESLVQETLTQAHLRQGDFPGFYTNESYYFAFCREMFSRISTPAIVTDDRGVAWLRGTRVKVLEVVASHLAHGWSPEELRRQHPGLRLSAIHAALAWYYDHRDDADRALTGQLDEAERLRVDDHDSPLRARLRSAGLVA